MKNVQKTGFALFILSVLFLSSCKKDNFNLSSDIKNIIPTAMLKELKGKGMVINEGTTPPSIEGIYLANPYTLKSPYGPSDSWVAGRVVPDYKYKIYNQNEGKVQVDYKQPTATDKATGIGAFVSGSGNKFTIFAQINGTANSVSYSSVSVISGEITPTGIKDFQYGFIFTKKTGDDNNAVLIPTGKSRIWIDSNNFADKISTYRVSESSAGTIGASSMGAIN